MYEKDSTGGQRWYYPVGGSTVAQREQTATSDTTVWLTGDQVGSVSLVTGDAASHGNIISDTEYSPWGETHGGTGTKPTALDYTGAHRDGTGLVYLGSRYYDPTLGRFLSPDSAIDGVNPYSYVHNNLLTHADPTGHSDCSDERNNPNSPGGSGTCSCSGSYGGYTGIAGEGGGGSYGTYEGGIGTVEAVIQGAIDAVTPGGAGSASASVDEGVSTGLLQTQTHSSAFGSGDLAVQSGAIGLGAGYLGAQYSYDIQNRPLLGVRLLAIARPGGNANSNTSYDDDSDESQVRLPGQRPPGISPESIDRYDPPEGYPRVFFGEGHISTPKHNLPRDVFDALWWSYPGLMDSSMLGYLSAGCPPPFIVYR